MGRRPGGTCKTRQQSTGHREQLDAQVDLVRVTIAKLLDEALAVLEHLFVDALCTLDAAVQA